MPQGIGRLRDAARRRFPRTCRLVERYHTTITALTIIIFVAAVAYIGVNQQQTETTVTHIRGDVNIIKRQSACSPRQDGKPRNRKACNADLNTIIHKILTPLQACEFLERGASLIKIGGQPIPHVECVRSRPESSGQASGTDTGAKQEASADHGASTGGQTAAAPVEHTVIGTNPSPNGGTHTGSTGGHHPSGGTHAGAHKTPHPHPASPPVAPESHPEPTPTSETVSSGGTGASGEQGGNAGDETETTPPPAEPSTTKPKLLPEVIGPVEELACGLTGKLVCHE